MLKLSLTSCSFLSAFIFSSLEITSLSSRSSNNSLISPILFSVESILLLASYSSNFKVPSSSILVLFSIEIVSFFTTLTSSLGSTTVFPVISSLGTSFCILQELTKTNIRKTTINLPSVN